MNLTTIPELAHRPARADTDIPFTTSSPSELPGRDDPPRTHTGRNIRPCRPTGSEAVFGRRQIPASPLLRMIPDAIDEMLRVFETNTHRYSFASNGHRRHAELRNTSWAEWPAAPPSADFSGIGTHSFGNPIFLMKTAGRGHGPHLSPAFQNLISGYS